MTVLFSRGLGLVYCMAFGSLIPQILGLYGSQGIFPTEKFGDGVLLTICWVGVVLGISLQFQKYPRVIAFVLWGLFLNLSHVGPVFLQYQWEALLLEVGFLAIFLNPKAPNRWVIWLFRILIFRLLFMSGASKLLSGDPYWRDFTATVHHFESQPLPTALGWLWHQMPLWFHRISCGVMFFMELVVPFLIFFGPKFRKVTFFSSVLLQIGFILTGNYGYFNYLCIVLSLLLLEPQNEDKGLPPLLLRPVLVVHLLMSVSHLWVFSRIPPIDYLHQVTAKFQLTSPYGLFAVMTIGRRELVIEGSFDRINWKAYKTRFNPDAAKKMPGWIAPHQPRLDWQLWFAALGDFQGEEWLKPLLLRLFEGSLSVGALFKENPFPDQPPKYLRIRERKYSFSSWSQLKEQGDWWIIEDPKPYSGELTTD